ncbi:FAD/NAD(P)-binding protein [Pelagovum pacificum]|uniref:FAD-dependent urate hydroxylase HpyO/Asp monooxygenase CreE-like FAD/NAD(P)-binding domain-containing protein n=1 Tax=Pelagovum pacificum TaxID=2588711 RepID=A0A5C5GCN0_9RHOB|nr:FAD/NAD(P)-binding domain-containing protein [Pelagovum pacificum]QQA41450.1 FAD/NAD(P)-binding protein [Pelagovum pacificum]TNY31747.1 hypothetical protein FHY64_00130 [Pelagovum pacificum]
MRGEPVRVAIVGCGPKGLYCLDALAEAVRGQQGRVDITLFEPAPTPAAGLVYDPAQPGYLLMNFAARHIDAWPAKSGRPSFLDWAATEAPDRVAPDGFPPRRDVGRYLTDCLALVRRNCPRNVRIKIRPRRVTGIARQGARWSVATAQDSTLFDEVMIATGHQNWQGTAEGGKVFPVRTQLSPERVPAGSPVTVRGFGLTAIDAVLALTVGRGGAFDDTGNGLTYRTSGQEPARIDLRSRTGRPMLAKADLSRVQLPQGFEAATTNLAAAIAALDTLRNIERELLAPICFVVDDLLGRMPGSTRHWLTDWSASLPGHDDIEDLLRNSRDAATGVSTPDIPDLLGLTWRAVYPALVRTVSHGGLDPVAGPDFRSLTTEMERIAFGPPPLNVARLVALSEAGLVTFGRLSDHSMPGIDATLPAASAVDPDGPVSGLLADGTLRRNDFGTIAIDRDGCALGLNGRAEGLSVTGRLTEVDVLGNDTLNRSLHQLNDRWAARVAARAMEPSPAIGAHQT